MYKHYDSYADFEKEFFADYPCVPATVKKVALRMFYSKHVKNHGACNCPECIEILSGDGFSLVYVETPNPHSSEWNVYSTNFDGNIKKYTLVEHYG